MKATLSMPKGLDAILEALAQQEVDLDAAAARALSAGAEVAVEGIKRRARVLSGEMRDAAKASEVKKAGNEISIEVGWPDADGKLARKVNANEFGTSSMEAQPMVRPTMAEDKKTILGAMKSSLEEEGYL